MTHIKAIGAGMFSDLALTASSNDTAVQSAITSVKADQSQAATVLPALFTSESNFLRIQNIRELPAMGTAPNIVNVPLFGQKVSKQIQGQADAPSMEIQINYVAKDWGEDTDLFKTIGDGKLHVFRFTILNSKPVGYANTAASIATLRKDPTEECENTEYYFWGKMEAFQVTPQLTDATTATLTISIQSEFFGAYTIDKT